MKKFEKEELTRYSRQMMLPEIGFEGQTKIKDSKVLVIGAGGLGCPVLQYLAGAGVGTLGIVDFDKVELHNIHRQILYTVDDIGLPKAKVAAERLQKHNPHIHYQIYEVKLNTDNAAEIISQYDIVVDGSDNFTTRYLVNDACVALHKPLVYGSVFKFEGQVAVFNYQQEKNLRDIYPEPPAPEDVPNCSEMGVIGVLPGVIGTMMANYVIQIITETGHFADGFTLINLWDNNFMKLSM